MNKEKFLDAAKVMVKINKADDKFSQVGINLFEIDSLADVFCGMSDYLQDEMVEALGLTSEEEQAYSESLGFHFTRTFYYTEGRAKIEEDELFTILIEMNGNDVEEMWNACAASDGDRIHALYEKIEDRPFESEKWSTTHHLKGSGLLLNG